jgi:hypothetical protein
VPERVRSVAAAMSADLAAEGGLRLMYALYHEAVSVSRRARALARPDDDRARSSLATRGTLACTSR